MLLQSNLANKYSWKWLAVKGSSDYADYLSSDKNPTKPGNTLLQSDCFVDPLRKRLGYMHYSPSTEKPYLHWVKFLVRWQVGSGVMRQPQEMAGPKMKAFLTSLGVARGGCPSA